MRVTPAPPVTISVAPGSPSIRASVGIRPRLSTTTLRGCRPAAAPGLIPGRQPRIVRQHRVDPHHHRVRRRPQPVSVGPRLLSRDPLRRPRTRGYLAIQAHGELRRDERRSGLDQLRVPLDQPRRLPGHLARRDHYPRLREPRQPPALHVRVRVRHRRVDRRDARRDDRLRARARPALVIARLERSVESSAARPRPSLPDGHDLRVSLPRRPRVPLAHHSPSRTSTAPTGGFGLTEPTALSASESASPICPASAPVVASIRRSREGGNPEGRGMEGSIDTALHYRRRLTSLYARLAVGSVCPWYLLPSAGDPVQVSTGVVRRR